MHYYSIFIHSTLFHALQDRTGPDQTVPWSARREAGRRKEGTDGVQGGDSARTTTFTTYSTATSLLWDAMRTVWDLSL